MVELHALDASRSKPVDLRIRDHGVVMDYPKIGESFEAVDGLDVKVIIGPAPERPYKVVNVVPPIKPKLCHLFEIVLSQLDTTKEVIHLWNRAAVVRFAIKS
jgi:hypothetical protein